MGEQHEYTIPLYIDRVDAIDRLAQSLAPKARARRSAETGLPRAWRAGSGGGPEETWGDYILLRIAALAPVINTWLLKPNGPPVGYDQLAPIDGTINYRQQIPFQRNTLQLFGLLETRPLGVGGFCISKC